MLDDTLIIILTKRINNL